MVSCDWSSDVCSSDLMIRHTRWLAVTGVQTCAHPISFVKQATRFRAPVFIGDTIYPEHEIVGLERKRSAGLLTLRVALRNQRGEVVLDGEHRYLIAYRPTG